MAYLHYKVRTQDKLDRLLTVSINRLKASAGDESTALGVLPGHLLTETRLPPIQKRASPTKRTAISRPFLSLEQRAQIKLKKIMKLNRQVTSVQLADRC